MSICCSQYKLLKSSSLFFRGIEDDNFKNISNDFLSTTEYEAEHVKISRQIRTLSPNVNHSGRHSLVIQVICFYVLCINDFLELVFHWVLPNRCFHQSNVFKSVSELNYAYHQGWKVTAFRPPIPRENNACFTFGWKCTDKCIQHSVLSVKVCLITLILPIVLLYTDVRHSFVSILINNSNKERSEEADR